MVKGHIGAPFGEESVLWTLEQISTGVSRRNSSTTTVESSESSLTLSMDDGDENKTEEEENDHIGGARAVSLENSLPPLQIYNISQDNAYPPLPILNANISPAEMAMQDSENNNVDENSNDQQYSEYTEYHQQYGNHQFVPDRNHQFVPDRNHQSVPDQNHQFVPDRNHQFVPDRNHQSVHDQNHQFFPDQNHQFVPDQNNQFVPDQNLQSVPDQSVRPRVPRQRQNSERVDEPDLGEIRPRTRSFRNQHRRSCSDDAPQSSSNHYYNVSDEYAYSHIQHSSDRLPSLPNQNQGRGGDSRQFDQQRPRNWSQRNVTSEETQNQARDLMVTFTIEELMKNSLAVPDTLRQMQRHGNPGWARAGMELRQLADTFAETEERRRVRMMAERVNMSSINMDNFFQLCTELFSDGITRERIVALFTFIADVAIYHVRSGGNQFIQCLMDWSLQYLWHRICTWVQDAGGWSKVLSQGMSIIYRGAVIAFCFVGTIAAGVFIAKTLKEM